MLAKPKPLIPLLPRTRAEGPLFVGQVGSRSYDDLMRGAAFVARRLPAQGFAINLCEDRYRFTLGFCAALMRGLTTLMPPNRLPATLREVAHAYPGAFCLADSLADDPGLPSFMVDDANMDPDATAGGIADTSAELCALIAFTSGSTGRSRPHPKRWGDLVLGARIAADRFGFGPDLGIVATVPSQHMYGLELAIMVPLVTGTAVDTGRPFFPADIRAALARLPSRRLLVTTPVHLAACLDADLDWPAIDGVISATAPLPIELARRAEQQLGCRINEIYGSTETGSIASRATCFDTSWRWYDSVRPIPSAEVTEPIRVEADFLPAPVPLADVIEIADDGGFRLVGRIADMVKVGGKRASLAELNLRLNAIDGVEDGVFVAPEQDEDTVGRLAAVVVAPGLRRAAIVAALRQWIDPVFLPRLIVFVDRLPRNEAGKLPRGELLGLVAEAAERHGAS